MVAVKSIMTSSLVYVGVIMSAADEFLVRIRFTMGKFLFFTGFVLVLLCAVFNR